MIFDVDTFLLGVCTGGVAVLLFIEIVTKAFEGSKDD